MSVAWERLIRFIALDGRVLYGEPILPSLLSAGFDLGNTDEKTRLQAKVFQGGDIYDTTGAATVTDEIVTVKKLLGPLTPADVPVVRCIGLNYATHIRGAGRKPPPFPSMFFKPPHDMTGHNNVVRILKMAPNDQADYEGELCVILGKDAKDVSWEDDLSYVAGYTAGNDISSRKLQRDPALAGGVPQWGISKGFDTFAQLVVQRPAASRPKAEWLYKSLNVWIRHVQLNASRGEVYRCHRRADAIHYQTAARLNWARATLSMSPGDAPTRALRQNQAVKSSF